MNAYVEWGALGNVILFGLLIGAGLPALYAIGVRSLDASAGAKGRSVILYRVVAYACFGVVLLAILGALGFIAAGGH